MIREVRDWASKWIIHLLHFLCCLIGLTKDIHNHELHTSISKSPSFFFQYWIYFFQETHSTRKLQTQQGCGYVVRVRMTSAQYSYGGRWAMWQCVYSWVVRCDYADYAQCIRVGLQRRLFGVNTATPLSKAIRWENVSRYLNCNLDLILFSKLTAFPVEIVYSTVQPYQKTQNHQSEIVFC